MWLAAFLIVLALAGGLVWCMEKRKEDEWPGDEHADRDNWGV